MTPEEITALAGDAAAGDVSALDRLLLEIRPQVLRHCGRVLANPLDAEEACQDTLFAVSRRISSFAGRSKFETWLYRVTLNASLDTYRKLKRRASTIDIDSIDPASPARTSVVAGNRIDLLDAFEQVPPKFGLPVMLRDVYDLDYAEIAAELDIAVGTVKSRIHEGRQTMQYLLERS